MARLDDIFASARQQDKRLLMPFVCAGHPCTDSLPPLLKALQHAGAAIAEVGFPFSDPIADGPTIAAAMHQAIEQGITPRAIFKQVRQARDSLDLGLVAMVSASIVYRAGGPEGFAKDAAEAGFDGVIYPDISLEEAETFLKPAQEQGLSTTLLISPNATPERAEALAKASTGFVYLLARTGITGERAEAPDVARRVKKLREWTDLPIACGFGISTPDHVRAVVKHADAAIVGSALIRHIDQAIDKKTDPLDAAG
ncbi:Tryptophan synthase alpha chain, partial [hydrothermal vent metagenome]